MITYKFDRHLEFIIMVPVAAVTPAMSLVELLTTGTIDFDAVSPGRTSLPFWFLYLIGWPVFLALFYTHGLPAMRYLAQGYVFRVGPNSIWVSGHEVPKSDITGYHWTSRHILRIDAGDRSYRVHPGMNSHGKAFLESVLDEALSEREINQD
jgi:hypothetical protein